MCRRWAPKHSFTGAAARLNAGGPVATEHLEYRIRRHAEKHHQHGGGGASTSLGSIALRPSGHVSSLKLIMASVAFAPCAHRLRLQKS
jgi:hypothetical protein